MQDWVQVIGGGGAFSVLAMWVWSLRQSLQDERNERQALQAKNDALVERTLKALSDSQLAMQAGTEAQRDTLLIVSGLKDLMMRGTSK